jgi:hypothetical protein
MRNCQKKHAESFFAKCFRLGSNRSNSNSSSSSRNNRLPLERIQAQRLHLDLVLVQLERLRQLQGDSEVLALHSSNPARRRLQGLVDSEWVLNRNNQPVPLPPGCLDSLRLHRLFSRLPVLLVSRIL